MIGQNQLLNYFVAGARQILNLVNQNKQFVHCDFTSDDYVKKLHFCYILKGYLIPNKTFWIHQYLYFHNMYERIVGT